MNAPDEGYSRNVSYALNFISTFLLQLRLRDYVVSSLDFARAKEIELAWVDGQIDMKREKRDTKAMYEAEEGEIPDEKTKDGVFHIIYFMLI